MRIRMLETRRGTEDGFTIKQYNSGEEYDVRDHLALAFLAAGFAIPIKKSKKKKSGDVI